MAKKAIVFLANGVEETEFIASYDILKRAGVEVETIGVQGKEIISSSGVKFLADSTEKTCPVADILILPGGLEAVRTLEKESWIIKIIEKFNAQGKLLGAICAAPTILSKAQVLKSKYFTCYPGQEKSIEGNYMPGEKVVVDGNVITARSVASTFEFALEIVEMLEGKKKRQEVEKRMIY